MTTWQTSSVSPPMPCSHSSDVIGTIEDDDDNEKYLSAKLIYTCVSYKAPFSVSHNSANGYKFTKFLAIVAGRTGMSTQCGCLLIIVFANRDVTLTS